MFSDDDESMQTFSVVVNLEEQYSIWPTGRELPPGWRETGRSGSKADCLSYIEEVWTDMRPLSLRKQMDEAAARPWLSVEPDPPKPE
jgi:MbtH protein